MTTSNPDANQLFLQHPRLVLALQLLAEHDEAAQAINALQPSQRRTATLVAKGFSNTEIARLLGIRKDTICNQVNASMRRLGVSSRCEVAVVLAKARLS